MSVVRFGNNYAFQKAGPWGFEPQSLAPKAKRIIQTTLRAQKDMIYFLDKRLFSLSQRYMGMSKNYVFLRASENHYHS